MSSRLLAAVVLALGVSAPIAAPAQTLDFSWPLNVGPLNPHLYSPSQMFAQAMVYEPLVKYQADGTVAPWLAESWSISEDGRTFTFVLRPGVTFSNGEAFDAAVVKKNFDAVLANAPRHAWLGLIAAIERVDLVDAMTIAITTKEAYYPLLQEMALVRPVRFLAPAGFPESGETSSEIAAPIGTGPWVLSESVLGQYDLFTRNETYWGEKPAFDSVRVAVIEDPNTRAIALETGQIDMIYGVKGQLTPDTYRRLADAGYESGLSVPLETMALALHSGKGPTADRSVRQAINHAVNKDALVEAIYYGTQERADTLFAPTVPYADIGLVPYAYDPAQAAALLEADGWGLPAGGTVREKAGEPLAVDLVYTGNDAVMKAISEVIQGDLAQVGIAVRLVAAEETDFNARQKDGNFHLIYNRTWGAPYDPHAFVSSMRVPSHADFEAQSGLAQKAEIDATISAVLVSTDEAERQAQYDFILRTLHEEAVYLPISYVSAIGILGRDVTGLTFGATSHEFPFETVRPKD